MTLLTTASVAPVCPVCGEVGAACKGTVHSDNRLHLGPGVAGQTLATDRVYRLRPQGGMELAYTPGMPIAPADVTRLAVVHGRVMVVAENVEPTTTTPSPSEPAGEDGEGEKRLDREPANKRRSRRAENKARRDKRRDDEEE